MCRFAQGTGGQKWLNLSEPCLSTYSGLLIEECGSAFAEVCFHFEIFYRLGQDGNIVVETYWSGTAK